MVYGLRYKYIQYRPYMYTSYNMLCTVLIRSAILRTSLLVQKDGCHDMVSFSMVLLANMLTPFSLF